MAGVQPLWRRQPLHRRRTRNRRQRRRTGVPGQLQPPHHHPRDDAGGLPLQRGVPDDPLARAQRVRRQLHRRRRHRPVWRRAARAQGLPVGGSRRVLVGRTAHQCRGSSRCRRQPRLLQQQRGLLAHPLRGQHGRCGDAVPDTDLLQGDAQLSEQPRSDRRVDGHLARSTRCRLGEPAGERADRPDLHGQQRLVGDDRTDRGRPAQAVAQRARSSTSPGADTFGDQVIGYEWDEDLDNGARPYGTIRLSRTPPWPASRRSTRRRTGRCSSPAAQPGTP